VAAQRTTDEEKAKAHFSSTVSRDVKGRFVGRLPFAQDLKALGDSHQCIQKRFFKLERRFAKEPGIANEYKAFMTEYLSMEIMEVVTNPSNPWYYLPHHAVLKADILTTKLFDRYLMGHQHQYLKY